MGLGSEIRDPEKHIPDPWVKKAPDPDPQHWSDPTPDLSVKDLKFKLFGYKTILHESCMKD
jgi:hypothetical protein